MSTSSHPYSCRCSLHIQIDARRHDCYRQLANAILRRAAPRNDTDLANALAEFGIGLDAGEIILPGALTKSYDAKPGDTFSASYDGMGSVNVRFV